MFVMSVIAVLLPRFELSVAAGGGAALLRGPVALAPEPGTGQAVGEVSAAAEAFGVRAGMGMGEALARCPRLALVPPDPAGVAEAWEALLARLEGVGAGVAPERPGLVCFAARRAAAAASAAACGGDRRRPARGRAPAARVGAGPRALLRAGRRVPRPAAAPRGGGRRARPRRAPISPLPVALLRAAGATAALPGAPGAARGRHAGRAGRAAPGRGGRPLRAAGPARARPRPRRRRAAAPARGRGARGGDARAARGRLGPAARARARAARGPHARPPRAARANAARRRPGAALVEGGTWRERVDLPRGHRRPARGCASRSVPAPGPASRAGARRCDWPSSASGRRCPTSVRCSTRPPPTRDARLREAVAQARAPPGRTPPCAWSTWIPGPACPSAVRCWRPTRAPEPSRTADVTAPRRLAAPRAAAVRAGPDGRPLVVDRPRGRRGPRVLAGRGRLVDRPPAAPPLLGGGHRRAAATSSSSTISWVGVGSRSAEIRPL